MNDARSSTVSADRANTFPWPPILFVAAILAALVAERALPLPWPGLGDTAAQVIGYAFGIIGIGLVAWGLLTLRRSGTTVMPDKASTVLVTGGPFGYFRNPIYLGEVLILFALAEAARSIWFVVAAAVFAALVTPLQILPEERHLEARFGDAYRAYKARTRRWI